MTLKSAASRWETLQRLFSGALDVVEAERPAWLDAQTQDPEIVDEVRRLLDHHAGEELSTADVQRKAAHLCAMATEGTARFGAWTLLSLAGSGGMGSVYLAERHFAGGKQRAALKISHSLLADAESARRLRFERSTLASINHPGISRLIDTGETDEGRPWFAMEWVEGEPLLNGFFRQRMTLRQRIESFRRICAALSAAHQRLVLHRDIKSSNVLLDTSGEPRIVDFGIAKLLTAGDEAGLEASVQCFTAHCAAPEQIVGGPATTAIDVYALGALLYEALAGTAPLRLRGVKTAAELARIVTDEVPPAPSRAVVNAIASGDSATRGAMQAHANACGFREDTALSRALTGDLDRIALQCLRKDPNDRYRSIDDLDNDLRRWLDGLPVLAAGQSFAYRTRKLAWRYRIPLAAGTTTIVAMATLSVGLAISSNELRTERDRARYEQQRSEIERNRADATTEFLVDAFQRADPRRAGSPTVSTGAIVESALEHLEKKSIPDPEIVGRLAMALADVGQATGHRGSVSKASELYAKAALSAGPPTAHHQTQLALLAGRVAANARDLPARAALIRVASASHAALASPDVELEFWLKSQQAVHSFDTGDRQAALDQWRVLRERVPPGLRHGERMLRLDTRIAGALRTLGRPDEAAEVLRSGLAASEQYPDAPANVIVDAKLGLAHSLRQLERYDEALRFAREALDPATTLFGARSTTVASTRAAIATTLDAMGRHHEAQVEHQIAVDIFTTERGTRDPNSIMSAYNLVRSRIMADGSTDDLVAQAEQVAQRAVSRWGRGHPNAQVMALLAAEAAYALGNLQSAREKFAAIVDDANAAGRAGLTAASAVVGLAVVDAALGTRNIDASALESALIKLNSKSDEDDHILAAGRALQREISKPVPLATANH